MSDTAQLDVDDADAILSSLVMTDDGLQDPYSRYAALREEVRAMLRRPEWNNP